MRKIALAVVLLSAIPAYAQSPDKTFLNGYFQQVPANGPNGPAQLDGAGTAGALNVLGRTLAQRAQDTAITADAHVVCNGSADDTTNLQSAINTAATAHKRLYIQSTTSACNISAPLVLQSYSDVEGLNSPKIQLTNPARSTAFDLSNTTNVTLKDLVIDGGSLNMTITQNPPLGIVLLSNTTNADVENIQITNTARDFRISNSNHNIFRKLSCINCGSYNAFTLDGSSYNEMEDIFGAQHVNWTLGVINNSLRNRITRLSTTDSGAEMVGLTRGSTNNIFVAPRAELPSYPTWSAGLAVTKGERIISTGSDGLLKIYIAESAGTTGTTAPSCIGALMTLPPTVTCSDGAVTWDFWREFTSTGDNCISLTGDKNVVIGGVLKYCKREGVALFGSFNTLTGSLILNAGQGWLNPGGLQYAGVFAVSEFSGISQFNTITGNTIVDDQVAPSMYVPIWLDVGYPAWATGTPYSNLVSNASYVTNAHNLYVATNNGTSGPNPPTCTSGTCSDGVVIWSWVTGFSGNTQSSGDTIAGNTLGNSVLGVDIRDLTTGQPNMISQNMRISTTNFLLDGSGITFKGGNLSGLKPAQGWAAGLTVNVGESYNSPTSARTYRVTLGGTTTAGNAPSVPSGSQTTGDGIKWLETNAASTFPQFTVESHFFNIPGCIKHGAIDSATAYTLDCTAAGTPLGVVAAPIGSQFHRTDGGAGTSLYIKESGADASGWVAK